jgi:hypothetical protein
MDLDNKLSVKEFQVIKFLWNFHFKFYSLIIVNGKKF